jgi:hypothetical protein
MVLSKYKHSSNFWWLSFSLCLGRAKVKLGGSCWWWKCHKSIYSKHCEQPQFQRENNMSWAYFTNNKFHLYFEHVRVGCHKTGEDEPVGLHMEVARPLLGPTKPSTHAIMMNNASRSHLQKMGWFGPIWRSSDLPKELISHCKLPWTMSRYQSQSPSLDHKCAFSQQLEMRAHGFMGPHEKQTNVISEEHASYTPYYDMWDMLLKERGGGPPVIRRLGDLTWEPIGLKLHPPP